MTEPPDRRSEKLPFQLRVHYPHSSEHGQAASPAHILAAVRSRVESGTIKLDYEAAAREAYNEGDPFDWWERLSDRGKEIRVDAMRPIVDAALVIGPVSDGGSET